MTFSPAAYARLRTHENGGGARTFVPIDYFAPDSVRGAAHGPAMVPVLGESA